jgi:putative Mn2+ efflux pump MntP
LILPLAIDTFALAAALGVAGVRGAGGAGVRVTAVFTAFETVMPIVGMLIGAAAGKVAGPWAGYLAIGLVATVGVLMLRSGRDEDAEEERLALLARTRGLALIPLGLSISMDELTIGLTAGLIGLPIPAMIGAIAIQAFAATQAGLRLGGRLSEALRERAEWLAGVALLVIAGVLLALKLTGR